jgi:hypothetical protein
MSLVNTMQTQQKDDAMKAVFDVLNNKAMDVLTDMQSEKPTKE